MRAIVQCLAIAIILFGLNACVLAPAKSPAAVLPQQLDDDVERLWWAVRYRIYWLPINEPDWAMDHLLAHAVFKPALDAHIDGIPLWRFHRRAAPDGAGHQFSFIFYADEQTATRVKSAIQGNAVSRGMLGAGFVEKLILNSHRYPRRELVQSASDPNWSPAMQRNWPAFIMGVSELWLGLIDEFSGAQPLPQDAAGMLAHYRLVEQQMTGLWRDQGLHALFHHVSAVFGYEPLPFGEKEVRF